jgi:putative hemolysin
MLWSEVDFVLVGGVICVVFLLHGLAEAAEVALLSANRLALREQAQRGSAGAARALQLAEHPARLLSTVAMVRKLLSSVAAVYLGSQLISDLETVLRELGGPAGERYAHSVAVFIVSILVTVISLLLGTLIPKRLAVNAPESFARSLALPVQWLQRVIGPMAGLMSHLTDLVVGRVGGRTKKPPATSLQQIRYLIDQGADDGVLDSVEQRLASEVLGLGGSSVRSIMRPRGLIQALDLQAAGETLWRDLREYGHSRVPVYEGDLDRIVGVLDPKELLGIDPQVSLRDLQPLLRPPLFVPDNTRIDQLLLQFREKHDTLAVVVDEFGATRGVVTLGNILDLLVGDLLEENRLRAEQMFVPRRGNEWLVDGGLSLPELFGKLGVPELQAHAHAQIQTLGGLLLHELGRLPELGETLVWRGWEFEVLDLDGRRIDRVLVRRANPS